MTHNSCLRCHDVGNSPHQCVPPAAQHNQHTQPTDICVPPATKILFRQEQSLLVAGSSKGGLGITTLEHLASTCKAVQKSQVCFCSFFSLLLQFPVFQREFWSFIQNKSNHLTHSYNSESEEETDITLSRLERCLQSQLLHRPSRYLISVQNPTFSCIFPIMAFYQTIFTLLSFHRACAFPC